MTFDQFVQRKNLSLVGAVLLGHTCDMTTTEKMTKSWNFMSRHGDSVQDISSCLSFRIFFPSAGHKKTQLLAVTYTRLLSFLR
jgi:hypothetical protein